MKKQLIFTEKISQAGDSMSVVRQHKQDKEDVIDTDYVCTFCGYPFSKKVRKSSKHQKQTASTQVVCPNCGNFNKTYE